jgi:DNA-binding MarR family transcriptional regulator
MQFEKEILNAFRKIVQGLRVSSRRAEDELGLSGAQLFVLQILSERDKATINELADLTCTHQSSVSTVVSRLVKSRLVERRQSEADARKYEVSLTLRGEALLRNQFPTAQKFLFQAVQKLSAKEQKQLVNTLDKIIEDSGFSQFVPNLFFEEEGFHASND